MIPIRRTWLQPLVLSWCICLATVSVLRAGSLERMSFDQLVDRADVIVRGTVEEMAVRRPADRSAPPKTVIRLTVEKQMKGPAVSSLSIEQPGGAVGDIAVGVPGLPEFSPGEKVIVFLKREGRDAFSVVGGRQGKFSAKQTAGGSTVVEDFARRTEPLNSFLERLASSVKDKG